MALGSYNGHSGAKRDAVQRYLNASFRDGTLTRPTVCTACGQTEGRIDAHLENYDDPDNFIPLCWRCHMMVHCRFRNPSAFRAYRDSLRTGSTYPNHGNFKRLMGEMNLFHNEGPPTDTPVPFLDEIDV